MRSRRGWLAALLLAACQTGEPPEPPLSIDLAGHAIPTTGTHPTELIAPGRGTGLDGLAFGWAPADGRGTRVLVGRQAQLRFFASTDRSTHVELDLACTGDRGRGVRFLVGGADHGVRQLDPGANTVVLGTPGSRFGRGSLLVELRAARDGCDLALVEGRLTSGSGDRPWTSPEPITIDGSAGPPTIRMPRGSIVHSVLSIPCDAELRGRVRARSGPDTQQARAFLMGADGLRELVSARLEAAGDWLDIRVPLAATERHPDPSGTVGWISLRADSTPGPGVLEWSDLRVVGRPCPDPEPMPPGPALPGPPPRSGQLSGAKRPDVIVVLLDAARADAFSPFGGRHPTPALEALASEGTVFEQARSPSSWTGQSVPTILTGLHPDSLGIDVWTDTLPPGVPTLQELLSGAGWTTALWSQHPMYEWRTDLSRGFSRVRVGRELGLPTAGDLLHPEQPSLAFVHLFPPHIPYEPPEPYRGSLSSWYEGSVEPDKRFLKEFPYQRSPDSLTADDVRYLRDRYDETALWADALVGTLVDRLREAGRWENTLLVVLSDHGEAFLEHGYFLHSVALHREVVHVPFLIRWPGGTEGHAPRIASPVGLVDLVPTLVDGLGLGSEVEPQGRSLLPAVFDGVAIDRPVYAVTRGNGVVERPPTPSTMIEWGGWTLLRGPHETTLFHDRTDPLQEADRAREKPLRMAPLVKALLDQRAANEAIATGATEATGTDDAIAERLRELGYLE